MISEANSVLIRQMGNNSIHPAPDGGCLCLPPGLLWTLRVTDFNFCWFFINSKILMDHKFKKKQNIQIDIIAEYIKWIYKTGFVMKQPLQVILLSINNWSRSLWSRWLQGYYWSVCLWKNVSHPCKHTMLSSYWSLAMVHCGIVVLHDQKQNEGVGSLGWT